MPLSLQVNIGLRVLTRPMPAQLPEIYRTLGTDYAERVLPSIIQVHCAATLMFCLDKLWSYAVKLWYWLAHLLPYALCVELQETLKSVIAQYNASQLITMREVWRSRIPLRDIPDIHTPMCIHTCTLLVCDMSRQLCCMVSGGRLRVFNSSIMLYVLATSR